MLDKYLNKNLQILALTALGLALTALALSYPTELTAQRYFGMPVQKQMLLKVVKTRAKPVPAIVKIIKESGVNFQLTSAIEGELRAAKAKPQIIEAVRNNYRAPAGVAAARKNTGTMGANYNTYANVNTAASQTSARDDREERYDELYEEGVGLLEEFQAATDQQELKEVGNQLIDVAGKLIDIDSSRPEAYELFAEAFMFRKSYIFAEEYGLKAIARGGSMSFNVWHLSGAPHREVLHVGKGYITIESDEKFYEFNSSQIVQVTREGHYKMPDGNSVPVLTIATSDDGWNDIWNFAGDHGTEKEMQMIMRFIKEKASGGR